ncbi:nitroreductase [Mycolicibacterium litorale]|nr:nitroreductase [Mycolicibacterium litorale]
MAVAPDTWPRQLRDVVRLSNKYLLNPVMLRLAGTRYWYASLVHHTGRQSGKEYATPVVAERVGDRLIIPLPYGTQVDWLRNVLTASGARVTTKGVTYEIGSPEIIDATEALPLLPRDRRRTFERAGIRHFLRGTITK